MSTFGTLMTAAAGIGLLGMAFSKELTLQRGIIYIILGLIGIGISRFAEKRKNANQSPISKKR